MKKWMTLKNYVKSCLVLSVVLVVLILGCELVKGGGGSEEARKVFREEWFEKCVVVSGGGNWKEWIYVWAGETLWDYESSRGRYVAGEGMTYWKGWGKKRKWEYMIGSVDVIGAERVEDVLMYKGMLFRGEREKYSFQKNEDMMSREEFVERFRELKEGVRVAKRCVAMRSYFKVKKEVGGKEKVVYEMDVLLDAYRKELKKKWVEEVVKKRCERVKEGEYEDMLYCKNIIEG